MIILCLALSACLFLVVLNMFGWKPAIVAGILTLAALLLLYALELTKPLTVLTVAIVSVVLLYVLLTNIFKK